MTRHSNKLTVFAVLLAAALTGCGKDDQKKDFLARVDNSYLTGQQMASDLDTNNLAESRRNEYIRNWIETELLYKQAQKDDITKDEKYLKAVEQAKRELARAMLITKVLEENRPEYKEKDIRDYYDNHKNEFRLFYDSFLYNIISFSDENKAILFRSTLIETDWNKAANAFHGDPAILGEMRSLFKNDYQVSPNNVLLVIQQLLPGEVSIIMNTEPGVYTVVQLVKKIGRDEVPEFPLIKDKVEERYRLAMNRDIVRSYTKKLYEKYKVEIK